MTARDRQRLKHLIDRRRREQIARVHGRDLKLPRWDDRQGWREREKAA